ncbi:CYCD6 [Zea mays]|uniref:CYCD6 n=1 Tax=Zea mays TaxID=4577 RepID=A0A1D6IF15_MAIZE|nr:CYCD6 [Zea mays]
MATEEWELREEDAYAYEFEFDLENPFTSPADEPIASLLDAEGHHAPSISAAASATRSPCTRASPTSRSTTWIASSPRGNWRASSSRGRRACSPSAASPSPPRCSASQHSPPPTFRGTKTSCSTR